MLSWLPSSCMSAHALKLATHTHTITPQLHPPTHPPTHTHTHTHSMHVLDIHSAALLLDLPLIHNEASQPTCNQISAHKASQFPEHHSTHRPPRLRLLDVGAGDGAVTAELAPLFAGICEAVLKYLRPGTKILKEQRFWPPKCLDRACAPFGDVALRASAPQIFRS